MTDRLERPPRISQAGSGRAGRPREYELRPLFSVDDKVPLLGGAPGQEYRMIGIPDGLGAHPNGDGTSTLFMNHELNSNTVSEPVVGGPANRGAIVSQWILDSDGDPIAGRRAYDTVFQENTLVGPAPEVGNATRALARFCSGFLAGREHGFDRWIYLTNEEEQTAANTWLSDVQAHPPTTPPVGPAVTVEDGQLFLMSPAD